MKTINICFHPQSTPFAHPTIVQIYVPKHPERETRNDLLEREFMSCMHKYKETSEFESTSEFGTITTIKVTDNPEDTKHRENVYAKWYHIDIKHLIIFRTKIIIEYTLDVDSDNVGQHIHSKYMEKWFKELLESVKLSKVMFGLLSSKRIHSSSALNKIPYELFRVLLTFL